MCEICNIKVRFKHDRKLRSFWFLFRNGVPTSWLQVCSCYLSDRFGEIYAVDSSKCSRFVVDFDDSESGFCELCSHSYLFPSFLEKSVV